MKQDTDRKIKTEAITGEEYIGYAMTPRPNKNGNLQRIESWLAAPIRAHFERLDSLRVYDHRRNDG